MNFTTDWTTPNFEPWGRHLGSLKGRPANALELGSYEGRSACWFLENILTHEESRIVCVDSWVHGEIERRFLDNMHEVVPRPKHVMVKGNTHAYLRTATGSFDFIYIDADHQAKAVLSDAILSWPLLKPGGVLIFDDYMWTQPDPKKLPPKPGIDAFLNLWFGEYEILHSGWQVILRKC